MKITDPERDELYKSLRLFRDAFRFYLLNLAKKEFGADYKAYILKAFYQKQNEDIENLIRRGISFDNAFDFGHFKSFILKYKDLIRGDFGFKSNNLPTWLDELAEIRNNVAHFQEIDRDDETKARINMRQILRTIGVDEIAEKLQSRPTKAFRQRSQNLSQNDSDNDPLLESAIRGYAKLSFKVNSGREHRVIHSGTGGSLWIRPRYAGYRVATTGEAARIDDGIAWLVGPCDGIDNKGYKYWYLDDSNSIDKIIALFGEL